MDGSLDSAFGSGGEVALGTNSWLQGDMGPHSASVAIQPDGKIVVATDTLIRGLIGIPGGKAVQVGSFCGIHGGREARVHSGR